MRVLATGLLALLIGSACQPKETIPAERLYRSWEQQLSPVSSMSPMWLTFRPDGQLLYGVTQQQAPCCAPTFFSGTGKQLTFSGSSQRPECALVYCGQSPLVMNGPWTITSLTDTDLVLAANGQQLTFKRR